MLNTTEKTNLEVSYLKELVNTDGPVCRRAPHFHPGYNGFY